MLSSSSIFLGFGRQKRPTDYRVLHSTKRVITHGVQASSKIQKAEMALQPILNAPSLIAISGFSPKPGPHRLPNAAAG